MTNPRVYRVSDAVMKVLVEALQHVIEDPMLKWVSITGVEISRDLAYAKVYFSNLDDTKDMSDVMKSMIRAMPVFKRAISKGVKLRIVPNLKFLEDSSISYGQNMNELIAKARSTDKNQSDVEDADKIDDSSRKRLR